MSQRVYVIRNKKTGKEYSVDDSGWSAIKGQKDWEKRYSIVSERMITEPSKSSFIPDEIKEKALGDNNANTDRARRD